MQSTANQFGTLEARPRFSWVDLVIVAGLFGLLAGILKFGKGMWVPFDESHFSAIDLRERNIPYYAGRTLLRMWIAFGCSMLFTLIVGYAAAKSKKARFFILPALDILQSMPVLGFLSITVTGFMALFPKSLFGVECASIFAIFTSQVWNMAFGFYHSLVTIPNDLQEAGRSYGLSRWQRFIKIELPSSAYSLIWNSMMSFGGGWFFVAQSEAITVLNKNIQLPGLGSYMAGVIHTRNTRGAIIAIVAMIILILVSDQLIWKPLLAWADKFKVQLTDSSERPTSWMLDFLKRAYVLVWLKKRVWIPLSDFLYQVTGLLPAPRPARSKSVSSVVKMLGTWSGYGLFLIGAGYVLYQLFEAILDVYRNVSLGEIGHIFYLGLLTFLRVAVMTVVATMIWTPIGVWIGSHPKMAQYGQPVAQILASFPVNMTFPFVVGFFVYWSISINYGSIFLIAMGTQWYILFNVIAGAISIPNDLKEAARTYGLEGWELWKKLIIPAIFPFWITGACTAAGGAWNASIVAELAKWGNTTLTADGLGAYIAQVTASGDTARIICSIGVMSLFVVTLNKLIWRRLYNLAECKFKLD
ncbi:MAG TPA: ABC transporter permease subunit [Candidatus Methylacidiphilales bacterium]|nr:ABC transporter permease subunit [Candidatus Methylacidiphilales bacterium]